MPGRKNSLHPGLNCLLSNQMPDDREILYLVMGDGLVQDVKFKLVTKNWCLSTVGGGDMLFHKEQFLNVLGLWRLRSSIE